MDLNPHINWWSWINGKANPDVNGPGILYKSSISRALIDSGVVFLLPSFMVPSLFLGPNNDFQLCSSFGLPCYHWMRFICWRVLHLKITRKWPPSTCQGPKALEVPASINSKMLWFFPSCPRQRKKTWWTCLFFRETNVFCSGYKTSLGNSTSPPPPTTATRTRTRGM